MLPFKVHQFLLSGRHYLLLPKLTDNQMDVFAARLSRKGASVARSSSMVAKSKEGFIHIEPAGVCWAAYDPADAILPAVPDVLECKKVEVPLGNLKAMYFGFASSRGEATFRFATRVEASALWDRLRGAGECGLSPDEHAVVSAVLGRASAPCAVLADFPFDGAVPRMHRGRQYYSGLLDSATALATLRKSGSRSERNSYLTRNATLTFPRRFSVSDEELESLFSDLGEWCFFTPS